MFRESAEPIKTYLNLLSVKRVHLRFDR